ncbi:class I SAM-dependent methyltransferase [Priestia endophytica]|uniref:class I SAM-dependent methyltransferase n=1 Tax=Priestia endophytica TaxID=135735 RepID=UPI002281D418|nr:class I SAM-dependent methyltransferase [Priestia endophytica]MCY8235470.1 class I SAM-dependent methyltransferase [Priestia endophytica]
MSKNVFYEQVGVAMTCRSYEEYEKMFDLKMEQFKAEKVLDVAAGASPFTASAYRKGYDAYAVDPLYNLSAREMRKHGEEEIQEASRKLKKGAHTLLWDSYKTLEEHDKIRRNSFSLFMEQYMQNEKDQRFFHGALPHLPFSDQTFSLLLCNHFLFLYEAQFDFNFHVTAMKEMIRVTKKGG